MEYSDKGCKVEAKKQGDLSYYLDLLQMSINELEVTSESMLGPLMPVMRDPFPTTAVNEKLDRQPSTIVTKTISEMNTRIRNVINRNRDILDRLEV
jgi:hypothetical protein